MLDGAAALVGDPAKALQIDGTALCVAGLGLVAVRLMHNRLILFAGRLLFLLRRRRGRSGFGFLFTVGQVNVYLIFFLHIQNSIGLVLAVSRFGFRGVRHHYQRFAGAAVRGIAAIHILGRYIRGGGCRINGCGLPSAGEQLSYSSSQVAITFFINMLGVEALATRTYCVNIIMFVYLFSISMAQGGAICIGHLIGEKKPHAAFLLGKYVMKKSVMITLILSCIIAASGHTLLSWLTSNPEIIRMGVIVLLIDVVLEIGRPINIFATNALRAAGDVNYPFYVGLIVMWSVAVGVGYLFGIYWAWGICGMWVAFALDENIRGIIFVRRWYGMKWVNKSFVRS